MAVSFNNSLKSLCGALLKTSRLFYSFYSYLFQEITDLNAYFGVDEINEDEGHYFDSYLPMWATLWRVSNVCDYDYIIDHTKEVSEAGFRIYYDENDDELYLGIDGCGYDFIDAHWSKLYDLKGMKWHDESEAA